MRRWLDSVRRTLKVAADVRSELVDAPATPAAIGQSRHRMPPHALGILFLQAGRPDLGERYVTEGIPMRDGEPILDTPRLGDTMILLGVLRESLGRVEDAAWAHSWAVRAFAATRGDADPETIRARGNLGRVYADLGRYEEAEPILTSVIPVFEKTNNKSELGVTVNALGLIRQSQNRHAEALACFERALPMYEAAVGSDHPECAAILRNIARSAEATGDRVRSAGALKRAEGIQRTQ